MPRPILHRRRSDPSVTVHHGDNADCPDVQAGPASRCLGHDANVPLVGPEGPRGHLNNALQLVRLGLDLGEVMMGHALGPMLVVPVDLLDGIQRRLEAAIGLLELDGSACCLACGGTILPPTIGGVPRGTCRCQDAARLTDWNAARLTITHPENEPNHNEEDA